MLSNKLTILSLLDSEFRILFLNFSQTNLCPGTWLSLDENDKDEIGDNLEKEYG